MFLTQFEWLNIKTLPSKYTVLGLIPSSANKTGKHKIKYNTFKIEIFFSHGKF